jgi:hypothetical protein
MSNRGSFPGKGRGVFPAVARPAPGFTHPPVERLQGGDVSGALILPLPSSAEVNYTLSPTYFHGVSIKANIYVAWRRAIVYCMYCVCM